MAPVRSFEQRSSRPLLDVDARALLAGIRNGHYEHGRELSVEELVARHGMTSDRIRRALDRVAALGLVEQVTAKSARVARPGLAEWADTVRLSTGLTELCMREAIPTLDDDDRAVFHDLVEEARRRAAFRDHGYGESLLGVSRFFATRTPNTELALLELQTISRVVFILNPTPTLEQWSMNDYWTTIDVAVAEADTELGLEAAHVLVPHMEQHIARTAQKYASMES